MLKRGEVASTAATTSDRVVEPALPTSTPPQMVVVSGASGSGRTTLLREVVARLQRDAIWVDCSVFAHRLHCAACTRPCPRPAHGCSRPRWPRTWPIVSPRPRRPGSTRSER